jgi:hypothetical protein
MWMVSPIPGTLCTPNSSEFGVSLQHRHCETLFPDETCHWPFTYLCEVLCQVPGGVTSFKFSK